MTTMFEKLRRTYRVLRRTAKRLKSVWFPRQYTEEEARRVIDAIYNRGGVGLAPDPVAELSRIAFVSHGRGAPLMHDDVPDMPDDADMFEHVELPPHPADTDDAPPTPFEMSDAELDAEAEIIRARCMTAVREETAKLEGEGSLMREHVDGQVGAREQSETMLPPKWKAMLDAKVEEMRTRPLCPRHEHRDAQGNIWFTEGGPEQLNDPCTCHETSTKPPRCGFVTPDRTDLGPCTRTKGHDGPCAHFFCASRTEGSKE